MRAGETDDRRVEPACALYAADEGDERTRGRGGRFFDMMKWTRDDTRHRQVGQARSNMSIDCKRLLFSFLLLA
jgi:hypothetical protein